MLSPIIEVAISLAFIYLLFSLVVSWINEFIASRFAARGKYLRKQLSAALNDQFNKNWAELLYVHPTVDLLAKREQRPPAYIPGNLFAKGLVDLIINEARIINTSQNEGKNVILEENLPFEKPINNFNAGLQKLNKSDVKILLQNFLDNSDGDLEKLKANMITWYDDYMDRVSGWYKKKIRGWLFLISLCVAVAFNVDTFHLITTLWKDANLRQTIVKAAEEYITTAEITSQQDIKVSVNTNQADTLNSVTLNTIPDSLQPEMNINQLAQRIDSVYHRLQILNLPVGYSIQACNQSTSANGYLSSLRCVFGQWLSVHSWLGILGWLITAGALSYGAPFWFDVLKKFVNVRSAGIKPEKVSSEDIKH